MARGHRTTNRVGVIFTRPLPRHALTTENVNGITTAAIVPLIASILQRATEVHWGLIIVSGESLKLLRLRRTPRRVRGKC